MKAITEKQALALAEKLVTLYYRKRTPKAVLPYMDARITCIGTGEYELSMSLTEIQAALEKEHAEYNGSFTIQDIQVSFTPTAGGGVLYGTLQAVPEDSTLSKEDVRITAVLEQADDGPKIVHLHFSHADAAQREGAYFVRASSRGRNACLLRALKRREQQLSNLTRYIPGGAHQCANDGELTLLSMSDGFLSMFGYTREDIKERFDDKFMRMIYPADREKMAKSIQQQLKTGPELDLEYRVICKSGRPMWVLDKGRILNSGCGSACYYCLLIDITERREQQEALRLSLERHKVIMNQTNDIIFEWDILRDTLEFSANWKKKFGYMAISKNISSEIPLSDNIHREDKPAFIKLMQDTAAGAPYSETEFRIRDENKRFYWCRIRATAQFDTDGRAIKAVGVITDIDDDKRQKQALIQQAENDALTGIYNKATLSALVEQRIQRSAPHGFDALFFIDVDHFKAVNDTYGHLCGDAVLSDVAAALTDCVRTSDLVGRIGGDEFLVYLSDISSKTAAVQKAAQLLEALHRIQPAADAPPITCSIGAVVVPHGTVDYHTLYRHADSALYRRKRIGRGGASFWNPAETDTEASVESTAILSENT